LAIRQGRKAIKDSRAARVQVQDNHLRLPDACLIPEGWGMK
jgi:hypothetical protein